MEIRLRIGGGPDGCFHGGHLLVVQEEAVVVTITFMAAPKSSFLDKVLGRIGRLDKEGLQTVVQRLARERAFLETLFNTIEDGVLVLDEEGRIVYLNQAVTRLLGLQSQSPKGSTSSDILPELDWAKLSKLDRKVANRVVRHEFEVSYPRQRFLNLYVAPLDGEAIGSSGLALIVHDATEARQKTYEAIESERVQALTRLAASVAHEIGNPLNALHIHLQLMERELKKLRTSRRCHSGCPGRRSPKKQMRPRPIRPKRRVCPDGEISRGRERRDHTGWIISSRSFCRRSVLLRRG